MSTLGPLAIGFVNPLLLGGLGMVLLPIIIHFLSRRRFRRIDWAATLFIRQAERESRRRTRLEQWLLLTLRCLALALLALLFARPFVEPGIIATLLGDAGPVERIILIDDSASLGYLDGGGRELDRLTLAADRLLGWLAQSGAAQPVTIYLTSQPDEPWLTLDRLDSTTLSRTRGQLASLPVSSLRAEPRRTLTTIADRIRARESATDRADVYVLSDFQRSDWLVTDGAAPVFAPLSGLESLRIVLISSNRPRRENVAIVELRAASTQAIVGMPLMLTVGVVNHSQRPAAGPQVALDLDGRTLPAISLPALMPGERREAACEITPSQAGYGLVSATLAVGDAFPADDTRRLVIPVRPTLNVLLVNGDPHPDPRRDEVHLLRHALAPPGPAASGVSLQINDVAELDAAPLDPFDAVVLCNVPPPSEAAADALDRFVRRGGGLLIFLGDQVGEPDAYNRVLYVDGRGALPVPLRELRQAPEGVGLRRAADHPVTAIFPTGSEALSEHVRFRAYYASEPAVVSGQDAPRQSLPTVLARFADRHGTPALIERAVGAGRVLLFTSTCDLDWNNWARSLDGSYVVAMLELVRYSAARPQRGLVYETGEPLVVILDARQHEPGVVVRSPAYPAEPPIEVLARVEAGPADTLRADGLRLTQLGPYEVQVRSRAGDLETWPAVVNLPAAESNLAATTATELVAPLGSIPHALISADEAFPDADLDARRELWRTLLLLGVAVLMSEQALALRFGRMRSRARSTSTRQRAPGRIMGRRSRAAARGTR
ncbi:MAG TPA: BatA domain-containing protein [Phycisphaerae bacterium]|nr:BatA domain-containing protein [Phycisphaerae bacterium]